MLGVIEKQDICKNLIEIDNFCRYTVQEISKNRIKKELEKYYLTK